MEALVFIFAEILFACLAPLLAMMGAILGAIIEAIAVLFGLTLGGASAKRPAPKSGKARTPWISRKALHWGAGILGGLGVAGVLASFLLFEPILGAVLTRAGDKAGICLCSGHFQALQSVKPPLQCILSTPGRYCSVC